MFKTAGGKYIAPQLIENKIKEAFYIEQVAVVGNNQKFASALIALSFNTLKEWCNIHKISVDNPTDMIKSKDVIKRYSQK
ncbi:long-chain fatty acid--CoA ligase [Flammeovirga kamogawensis]|uniref:Uncharacterized protein n=1 Tax=Flammeovirga kamogawensis TaxID=373891 RepID=A0ABX8GR45_9BACT|nr:long-chain fatty acid--CoA ligase [Flammeovirga kamogawensis]MBB6462728.1 long-subunit acyl-CoA synthetase (AMP-forming) [Flammeovirga kamogawensis]QWG06039.1 hypothetical protein KM029_11770 [Flammeovirga kamogawensis]TRX67871.1 long-chain fatty acid--CoA ligase [Flammeovirga kamogawensis]